ncbi:MAG: Ig domain-containing protein [Methylocella sp.]
MADGNGDTSGHVNKIPAQLCWETSNLSGGGSFNASACYAATTSPITSALSASGTLGTPFTYTITATNNPASFNASGLPAGFSANTATGVISGTPTAPGNVQRRVERHQRHRHRGGDIDLDN